MTRLSVRLSSQLLVLLTVSTFPHQLFRFRHAKIWSQFILLGFAKYEVCTRINWFCLLYIEVHVLYFHCWALCALREALHCFQARFKKKKCIQSLLAWGRTWIQEISSKVFDCIVLYCIGVWVERMMFMSTANHWKVHVCAGALPNLDLSCDVCVCVFRETAPHAFQLDLFFNNVSKPSTPVFDRLGRYSTHPPTQHVSAHTFINANSHNCYPLI